MAGLSVSVSSRILVVEDHPIFLKGLISLLKQEPDFVVVGEARERLQALEAVDLHHPEVALVDLSLGEDNGLDLIKDILYRAPSTRILVLSMHQESLYAKRALAAGALGFCSKAEPVPRLLEAIRTVAAGSMWLGANLTNTERDLNLQSLSDRELEVFRLIGVGLGTVEIAARLHISVKTVDTYKGNLKTKLPCAHAQELRRIAVEWVAREKRL